MIVKKMVSEELLTLAEAKEILNPIKEETDGELKYEKRRAIAYANKFAKTDGKSARGLANELIKLEKMKEGIAIKIADIMPECRDELRSIYAKERFALTELELDEILEIVARFK
jgi:DNA-directed RNA polymerase subunit F